MEGFSMLAGHLAGDFLFQNDVMAANKPSSHFWCTIHVAVYTLAFSLFNAWWLPWWALVLVGLTHYPIDRWRFARKYMSISGQEDFATGPLSPWSIVGVDQSMHMVVLYLIWLVTIYAR